MAKEGLARVCMHFEMNFCWGGIFGRSFSRFLLGFPFLKGAKLFLCTEGFCGLCLGFFCFF